MSTYAFRDPRPYATVAVVLQYIYLALVVANVAAIGCFVAGIPEAGTYLPLSGGLSVLGYVVAGIAFFFWTYRVVANARSFKPGINASPGWAIGWYFVPIAYLWKPFQYLDETWRVSFDPARPASFETPGLLRWWWGVWLGSSIIGYIGGQMIRIAGPESIISADIMVGVSQALRGVLVFMVIRIIRRLSERQVETHRGAGAAEVFT